MRKLVEPPPSLHCEHCRGELQLKCIVPDDPTLDLDVEIFVCAKCGHEQMYSVSHNRYAAHAGSKVPPDKVGSPSGRPL
jgi:hypothetical protein